MKLRLTFLAAGTGIADLHHHPVPSVRVERGSVLPFRERRREVNSLVPEWFEDGRIFNHGGTQLTTDPELRASDLIDGLLDSRRTRPAKHEHVRPERIELHRGFPKLVERTARNGSGWIDRQFQGDERDPGLESAIDQKLRTGAGGRHGNGKLERRSRHDRASPDAKATGRFMAQLRYSVRLGRCCRPYPVEQRILEGPDDLREDVANRVLRSIDLYQYIVEIEEILGRPDPIQAFPDITGSIQGNPVFPQPRNVLVGRVWFHRFQGQQRRSQRLRRLDHVRPGRRNATFTSERNAQSNQVVTGSEKLYNGEEIDRAAASLRRFLFFDERDDNTRGKLRCGIEPTRQIRIVWIANPDHEACIGLLCLHGHFIDREQRRVIHWTTGLYRGELDHSPDHRRDTPVELVHELTDGAVVRRVRLSRRQEESVDEHVDRRVYTYILHGLDDPVVTQSKSSDDGGRMPLKIGAARIVAVRFEQWLFLEQPTKGGRFDWLSISKSHKSVEGRCEVKVRESIVAPLGEGVALDTRSTSTFFGQRLLVEQGEPTQSSLEGSVIEAERPIPRLLWIGRIGDGM